MEQEVILLILEKLGNNIYILIAFLVAWKLIGRYMKKRTEFLVKTAYIRREVFDEFGIQMKEMMMMYGVTVGMVQIICLWSVYLSGGEYVSPLQFVVYYIPMLLLITVSRVHRVKKKLDESLGVSMTILIPGAMFHILFLVLILNAKSNAVIISAIFVAGLFVPLFLRFTLPYVVSQKDIKMIKLEMESGKEYICRYEDFIDDGKDEFVSFKIRKKDGNVKKIKKLRREDIKSKSIYLERPIEYLEKVKN